MSSQRSHWELILCLFFPVRRNCVQTCQRACSCKRPDTTVCLLANSTLVLCSCILPQPRYCCCDGAPGHRGSLDDRRIAARMADAARRAWRREITTCQYPTRQGCLRQSASVCCLNFTPSAVKFFGLPTRSATRSQSLPLLCRISFLLVARSMRVVPELECCRSPPHIFFGQLQLPDMRSLLILSVCVTTASAGNTTSQ